MGILLMQLQLKKLPYNCIQIPAQHSVTLNRSRFYAENISKFWQYKIKCCFCGKMKNSMAGIEKHFYCNRTNKPGRTGNKYFRHSLQILIHIT